MSEQTLENPSLKALRYHEAVCKHFEQTETKVWDWFSDFKELEKSFTETRDSLLKNTYRLTPQAHKNIYDLCNLAMQRLGINAPVTLYQANDGAMNAALFYIPQEVHIVLYGPLLEKLSDDELLALLGHELSHYLLWSMQDSRYLIAQQILEDSIAKAPHNNALYETARIYALNTETFADRGGVIAAQDEKFSIAVLVKVMTGLSKVDAASFLQQAGELEAKGDISKASSHPELYLRALLMHKWQLNEANLDDWIDTKLKGPINIHCLDILDQGELNVLTNDFFQYVLKGSGFDTEMVLNQVRGFFPNWKLLNFDSEGEGEGEKNKESTTEPTSELIIDEAIQPEAQTSQNDVAASKADFLTHIQALDIDDSTKDYFIALLFDIAHADKDQTNEVLKAGGDIMHKLKWEKRYRESLKTILKLPKTKIDKLIGKAKTGATA